MQVHTRKQTAVHKQKQTYNSKETRDFQTSYIDIFLRMVLAGLGQAPPTLPPDRRQTRQGKTDRRTPSIQSRMQRRIPLQEDTTVLSPHYEPNIIPEGSRVGQKKHPQIRETTNTLPDLQSILALPCGPTPSNPRHTPVRLLSWPVSVASRATSHATLCMMAGRLANASNTERPCQCSRLYALSKRWKKSGCDDTQH